MTTGINSQTALLAIGILQPATAEEVRGYLRKIFPDASVVPSAAEYRVFLKELELSGRVISCLQGNQRLYSLTAVASHELSAKARRIRDKRRLYLIRDARRRRFTGSRGVSTKELAGVSPALDTRSTIKGSEAKRSFGLAEEQGQNFSWPRISGQFDETGPSPAAPRGTFLPLLSFLDRDQAARAVKVAPDAFQLDFVGLGAVIGISPKLISQIACNSVRHYRTFTVPKKGGGVREIESPRVFLKAIQWVLLEFFFQNLRISSAVHSFEHGRSIVSNSIAHVGQRFVAAFDIKNFFGSVTVDQIEHLLLRNGYFADEASLLSRLCTKDERLPQGAPTSPILSNALLFDFDEWSIGEAREGGFIYTRYADDITASSHSRVAVQDYVARAEVYLRDRYSLHLNGQKTRIASCYGRQVVTGVVVNEKATPPRDRLRRIRAMFHRASQEPAVFVDRTNELAGFIGYIGQFPKFHQSQTLRNYTAVLSKVRATSETFRTKKARPAKVQGGRTPPKTPAAPE